MPHNLNDEPDAKLEAALRHVPPASAALTAHVLAFVQLPQQAGFDFAFLGRWFAPAATFAIAASLMLGFVLGGVNQTSTYSTYGDEAVPGLVGLMDDLMGDAA